NDLENIAKTSTSYTNQLESLRLRIDEKQKDYEIGQARLSSYYEYLLAKEEELIKIKNNLEQFLNVRDSYYDSWQNAILISSKLVTDINHEREKTKRLALESQTNADELVAIKNKLDLKKTDISTEEVKIKNLKEILNPLNDHIIKLEASIHNDELQVARLETQLINLKEKYKTITKQELPDNIDINYTTSEIRQFRAELAKLAEELALIGPVDLDSITEYKEITDRVDFLLKQLDDIKMGKEALGELLTETEKVMLKQFNQFFMLANESFKKTFGEIFEGGEAFLVLEDNDKLLEAGVNLEVKLKGKKTQALNLLSGGERALTCIAFIFALLRLRPAPFCLLDEIDAALDDTNLVRFANFLNKMAENMQFIIITHRQTTMAAAQNIYGITMPEKGISAVLTLSLDEAEGVAG
ncbi:MAG: AAA family ATPase, partial [Syntrophomonadaceae bacterium]|nr:AAA family ATPase [Syntrophomonadaceae bacterium]